MAVYYKVLYRYKYVTDTVNVGIKLLNSKMKEPATAVEEISLKTLEFSSFKFAYPSYDAPSIKS
jgi:hypothetical protein